MEAIKQMRTLCFVVSHLTTVLWFLTQAKLDFFYLFIYVSRNVKKICKSQLNQKNMLLNSPIYGINTSNVLCGAAHEEEGYTAADGDGEHYKREAWNGSE